MGKLREPKNAAAAATKSGKQGRHLLLASILLTIAVETPQPDSSIVIKASLVEFRSEKVPLLHF